MDDVQSIDDSLANACFAARVCYDPLGSVPPGRLRLHRPFRIGARPPTVDGQVSEALRPYAPLPVEWPGVIEAAAQASERE